MCINLGTIYGMHWMCTHLGTIYEMQWIGESLTPIIKRQQFRQVYQGISLIGP